MTSTSRIRQLVVWLCILVALGLNELLGARISPRFYDFTLLLLLVAASTVIIATLISHLRSQRKGTDTEPRMDRNKIIQHMYERLAREKQER